MTTPEHFSLEQFNLHQEDNRKRTEFLGKTVFLLSGGALTLSIGTFLKKGAPDVPELMVPWLCVSWISLFLSISLYVIVFSIMILRDYKFGENWRKQINGEKIRLDDSPGIADSIMWVLAPVAVFAFLFGFGSLAWVACNILITGSGIPSPK